MNPDPLHVQEDEEVVQRRLLFVVFVGGCFALVLLFLLSFLIVHQLRHS